MRPKRDQLNGLSYSELKTLLKRKGHKVPKRWHVTGFVTEFYGRLFRFRWWDGEFVVDVSCPLEDFDRWSNSCERSVPFKEWVK